MAWISLRREDWIDASIDRKDAWTHGTWFGVWLAVTIIAAGLKPDPTGHGTHQHLGLPPCPTVLLFDRPCPGCGMTTSWTATVHGDLATAFHAHPLGPVTYLIFTMTAWWALAGAVRGFRLRTESQSWNRAIAITLISFFAFGFARLAATPHYGSNIERAMASATLGR